MAVINHAELRRILNLHLDKGLSIMIRGEPGIGKTRAVEDIAGERAKREGRKLVIWSELTQNEQEDFHKDRKKREESYILSLIDLLTKLPEDLSGLPKMHDQFIRWLPDIQFWTLAQPEVKGIAFFDEFMQAQQAIQKPVANLFLKNMLGTLKLSQGVGIIAASNRKEDRCGVIDMLEHLKNRMSHVQLKVPSIKEWEAWAITNEIDERIIGTLVLKPDLLFQGLNERRNDAFATPRSWEAASKLVKDIPTEDIKWYETALASRVGDSNAAFSAEFVKLRSSVDCENLLNNPTLVEGLQFDKRMAFSTWLVEKASQGSESLEKVLGAVQYLKQADITMMVLGKISSRIGKNRLAKSLSKPELAWVLEYSKYLHLG